MLTLESASKRYGDVVALHPADLAVPPGETTVLIGSSGCGKSTVLRLMLGLLAPDTGRVLFDGAPVTADNALKLRRRMGYVIQDGGLFPHLTARQNATLLSRWLERPPSATAARVAELAELVRLPVAALDRFPLELSGGQRQRVALIRALMLDPPVLLLDEPLGALDPLIRSELQADLREIFRALHKTVVLVTHDMGEAAWFADEIVLLERGRVVQRGSLTDLLERPAEPFVADFINAQRSPLDAIP